MHHHGHHPPGHPDMEMNAPDGVDPRDFEAFVAFKNVMLAQRRLMTKLFAGEEVHPAQAGCLRILAREDGLSQSDLADRLQVSRPTVTTMLQRMEGTGVIERRADGQDQRLVRIYLTDAGRALNARLGAIFSEAVRLVMGPMTEKDRGELIRLLGQITDNVSRALEDR